MGGRSIFFWGGEGQMTGGTEKSGGGKRMITDKFTVLKSNANTTNSQLRYTALNDGFKININVFQYFDAFHSFVLNFRSQEVLYGGI